MTAIPLPLLTFCLDILTNHTTIQRTCALTFLLLLLANQRTKLKFMSNLLPIFLVTECRITFIDENEFILHISLTNLCAFPLLAICAPGFSTELEQDWGLTSTSDVNRVDLAAYADTDLCCG